MGERKTYTCRCPEPQQAGIVRDPNPRPARIPATAYRVLTTTPQPATNTTNTTHKAILAWPYNGPGSAERTNDQQRQTRAQQREALCRLRITLASEIPKLAHWILDTMAPLITIGHARTTFENGKLPAPPPVIATQGSRAVTRRHLDVALAHATDQQVRRRPL